MIWRLIGSWDLNLELQTSSLLLGKTAHLNSIQDMEFKICTQNISKKAATFQRREIRTYFNYEVINMRSIFFYHPLISYVTLFRCSYISIRLSLFLSRVLFCLKGFFFWYFNPYLCHLRGRPWKKKEVYLSVFTNYHRINTEQLLFTTGWLVLEVVIWNI